MQRFFEEANKEHEDKHHHPVRQNASARPFRCVVQVAFHGIHEAPCNKASPNKIENQHTNKGEVKPERQEHDTRCYYRDTGGNNRDSRHGLIDTPLYVIAMQSKKKPQQ